LSRGEGYHLVRWGHAPTAPVGVEHSIMDDVGTAELAVAPLTQRNACDEQVPVAQGLRARWEPAGLHRATLYDQVPVRVCGRERGRASELATLGEDVVGVVWHGSSINCFLGCAVIWARKGPALGANRASARTARMSCGTARYGVPPGLKSTRVGSENAHCRPPDFDPIWGPPEP
jgi:hypothetical protein